MKNWKYHLISVVVVLIVIPVEGSILKRKDRDGVYIIDKLEQAGMPREAVSLVFSMFDYNVGRIANTQTAVLVDYTLPSTLKRFHLMNLWTGEVQSYYVGHAQESGALEARHFSNRIGSSKSTLGFAYARGFRRDSNREVIIPMDGIDKSNSNLKEKSYVIYSATSISENFIRKYKRLAWSNGGLALGEEDFMTLANILQKGTLVLLYHADLMGLSKRFPIEQSVLGYEVIPPDLRRERAAGEE